MLKSWVGPTTQHHRERRGAQLVGDWQRDGNCHFHTVHGEIAKGQGLPPGTWTVPESEKNTVPTKKAWLFQNSYLYSPNPFTTVRSSTSHMAQECLLDTIKDVDLI